MALFRSEAQAERERAWLGRIVLARPLPFSLLTGAALAFVAALAAFLCLAEYTRKARLNGVLAPGEGVVRVIAQQPGRVEALHAREGETVERGAPLVVLRDPRSGSTFEDAASAIARRVADRQRALALQHELALAALRTEESAYERRMAALRRELEQLDREIEQQERRAQLAANAVARAEHLLATGFLSAAMRDREKDAALDAASRVETLRRARLGFSRELAEAEFEAAAARSRGRAQLSALDAQRAALEQEKVERELQFGAEITAPARGVVASVLVERGQSVVSGMTLATLIPEGAALEAQLFAPSSAIGFVRPGQRVQLRFLAYPHQKFGAVGARITSLSRNPLSPAELGFAPPDGAREPLYRIKAELDAQAILAYGEPEPLQAGMQFEADVRLDRRRLIEWVFEPLFSLVGRT